MLRLSILAGLAVFVAVPAPATAASFDCARAGSPSEKTICADPALSAADTAMAAVYAGALTRISRTGQDALRSNQRAWLAYRDQLCAPPVTTGPTVQTPAECLAAEFSVRTKLLASEGRRLGPYVMMILGSFDIARHKPDGTDPADSGLNSEIAIWPRIDSPDNARPGDARIAGWNRWIEDMLRPHSRSDLVDDTVYRADTDFDLATGVTLPADTIISVSALSSIYAGAVHPNSETQTFTYLLDQGRELRPADLFDPAKPWAKTLWTQTLTLLQLQLGDDLQAKDEKQPPDSLANPRFWTLGQQGLSIRFPAYAVAPYSAGEPEIVIPWRQLDDVLAAKPVYSGR